MPAVLVVWAVSVVWVAATAPQRCPPAALATDGSTIRSIAAAPRIETAPPQTGSAVSHGEIPWLTARPAPGNKSGGREGICPAIDPEAPASAIGRQAEDLVVGLAEPATALSAGGRIGSEAGIFRAAEEEAVMLSEGVRRDMTGQELALPAAAALPAWVLGAVVEASVVAAVGPVGVVVGGAGKALRYMAARQNEIARLLWIGQRLAIGNNVHYPSQKGEKGIP